MRNQKGLKRSGEVIVLLVSLYLVVFGVAGYLATDYVKAGFNALQNANSGVAIITDSGIVTENGTVAVGQVTGIVDNLLVVSLSSITFGTILVVSTFVRIIAKRG